LNAFEIAKNKIKNKYRFGPTAILLLLYTDKFHREFPTGREKMVCYEAGKFFHKYAMTVRARDEPCKDKDRDGINRMQEETRLRRAAKIRGAQSFLWYLFSSLARPIIRNSAG